MSAPSSAMLLLQLLLLPMLCWCTSTHARIPLSPANEFDTGQSSITHKAASGSTASWHPTAYGVHGEEKQVKKKERRGKTRTGRGNDEEGAGGQKDDWNGTGSEATAIPSRANSSNSQQKRHQQRHQQRRRR